MTEPINRETDDLAKVLNRISTLTQTAPVAVESVQDEDIPVLSERYHGLPANAKPEALQAQALGLTEPSAPALSVDGLLEAVLPLLQIAIRDAVNDHLQQTAEALAARLEIELAETLRQQLHESLQASDQQSSTSPHGVPH